MQDRSLKRYSLLLELDKKFPLYIYSFSSVFITVKVHSAFSATISVPRVLASFSYWSINAFSLTFEVGSVFKFHAANIDCFLSFSVNVFMLESTFRFLLSLFCITQSFNKVPWQALTEAHAAEVLERRVKNE